MLSVIWVFQIRKQNYRKRWGGVKPRRGISISAFLRQTDSSHINEARRWKNATWTEINGRARARSLARTRGCVGAHGGARIDSGAPKHPFYFIQLLCHTNYKNLDIKVSIGNNLNISWTSHFTCISLQHHFQTTVVMHWKTNTNG